MDIFTKVQVSNKEARASAGLNSHNILFDLLGDGIFNVDGDQWKLQRQLSSHVFSTKSLRHFVEHVVDTELNERLLPMLTTAAANDTVVDLQDVLQRIAFDNICKMTLIMTLPA
ncbi:hypothetical protein E3N88_33848 [Mikania micrantha]|uniref:Cytochrome P450 n=1 Tax=Mikania micrantha TaxID=192012 RepID=A0A5N6MCV0_9ASTR|nr:hypothetical protein E3N88_33848 [Mikania micrantha]